MLRGTVTSKSKKIKIKEAISSNLIPDIKSIEKDTDIIVFPFHDIQPKHKCILGTFVDYLIRKMIHEVRNDAVKERLICEIPIKGHHNYPLILTNGTESPWRVTRELGPAEFHKLLYQGCEPHITPGSQGDTCEITYTDIERLNTYKQYVENYRNNPWDTVLNDIWELSLLDPLYRANSYSRIECYPELLDVEHPFYKSLINTSQMFKDITKVIHYNPTLGRGKGGIFTAGDADLIYDDQLIDWKCTKNKSYPNDLVQCMIYAGLARDKEYIINKCSVHYLLFETYASVDINDWDEKPFMEMYHL